jgi:hypothetical protein
MDNETMRIAVVAIAAVAAVVVWLLMMKRRRTAALRARFGPEYDHVRHSTSTAAEAERELEKRQRRVEMFTLRPLARDEADQFGVSWRAVQARFVDQPRSAVVDADRLIEDVMRTRGYPVEDAAHRLDDLSVDHAQVVSHYRAGREIAVQQERGDATTEDLRQAMRHFRAIFEELVGAGEGRVRRAS